MFRAYGAVPAGASRPGYRSARAGRLKGGRKSSPPHGWRARSTGSIHVEGATAAASSASFDVWQQYGAGPDFSAHRAKGSVLRRPRLLLRSRGERSGLAPYCCHLGVGAKCRGLFLQPSAIPFVQVEVSEPLLSAFVGFLFALAVIGPAIPRSTGSSLLARAPDPLVQERVIDPDRMCLRDLRRLPSIGPARSLAIVRARFEQGLGGGPGSWTCINGIGPETVRAARMWIEAAGGRGGRDGGPGSGGPSGAARLSGPPGGAYTSTAADPGASHR